MLERCTGAPYTESTFLTTDHFKCLLIDKLALAGDNADFQNQYGKPLTGENSFFEQADADSDNKITQPEMVAWVLGDTIPKPLTTDVVAAMAGFDPNIIELGDLANTHESVSEATHEVEVSMTLNAAPESFAIGEKTKIKNYLMSVMDPTSEWLTAANFAFLMAPGSTVLTATAFAPDASKADAATSAMSSTMGTAADASAALSQAAGVTIEVTTIEVTSGTTFPELPLDAGALTIPIVFVAVAVVLCIFTCVFSRFLAKKKRAEWEQDYTGCCATGCCSAFALKGWATSTLLAVVFLFAAGFPVYNQMNAVAEDIKTILDAVVDISEVGGDAAEALGSVDSELTVIDPIRDYIDLLGVAAIVPTALAAVCLLFSAGCALRTSRTMCCAKFFAFLGHIFCIASIVFSAIWTALGVAVTLDFVQDILMIVLGICKTKLPIVQQATADGQAILSAATAAGQELDADIVAGLNVLIENTPILASACTALDDLVHAFGGLLVPGFTCVVASVYALWVIDGLCCAAKCCASPIVTGKRVDGESPGFKTADAVQDV